MGFRRTPKDPGPNESGDYTTDDTGDAGVSLWASCCFDPTWFNPPGRTATVAERFLKAGGLLRDGCFSGDGVHIAVIKRVASAILRLLKNADHFAQPAGHAGSRRQRQAKEPVFSKFFLRAISVKFLQRRISIWRQVLQKLRGAQNLRRILHAERRFPIPYVDGFHDNPF
ncbi:hypothetical protein AFE_1170 [Acidithiobacillus ferrooxidans ATCC 23270]|uniref:Uncharacterized protein n=1 Tax=Acidithiobacillus ferrooxidans (strain ATCC 23270 / DSM 14882 / CIP 104768 / NCIMB 8455) TaxID=243159 RepID=B7J8A4_ACIF2|nr:hypothetical protein AFE_1170 [Acidithiobacillus ferrooxidans ATCC 23270]